jgi:resuscitation-promoting factor RpfB
MRLYHRTLTSKREAKPNFPATIGIWLLLVILMAGCSIPKAAQTQISVDVNADGKTLTIQLPPGSTVQQALDAASLSLGSLDRTEPPVYNTLSNGDSVHLVRVTEKYGVEQVVIPFEHQTLRNESLPKDKNVLLQSGKNGLEEITYRRVFENGVEVSGEPVPIKTNIIQEALPEIVMTGVQTPFVPVAIPGRLVYLRDGNAWIIEETTGNRQAIVTKGDLDGYIFSLSTDGTWLLFTRRSKEEGQINSLWAAQIGKEPDQLIDLEVKNVVYFADWVPGSTTQVVYSTVEPQIAAPGWRSNNDLRLLTIFKSKRINQTEVKLETSLAGVYPWWGVSFEWATNPLRLAYANDHQVGVLDVTITDLEMKVDKTYPLLDFNPFQTNASWAWVPGTSWGPDGSTIYTQDHVAPPGTTLPEESQQFDLAALPLEGIPPLHLVSQVGMFAYPLVSPIQLQATGEKSYQVAYLQAAFPSQSETSRYRLMVMDRDGSNPKALFPAEGVPGLTPQREWGAWSPSPLPASSHFAITVIYQGNLWLVDTATGETQQITGDNLTSRVAWKAKP